MLVQHCVHKLHESVAAEICREQTNRLQITDNRDLWSKLTDFTYLTSLFERLSETEHRVLTLFLTDASRGFLAQRDWSSASRGKRLEHAYALTGLRRLGFIYLLQNQQQEQAYVVPQEVRQAFLKWRIAKLSVKKAPVHLQQQALPYYIPSGRGIHLDMIAVLLSVRQQPLRLTKQGRVARQALQKLASRISLQAAHLHRDLMQDEVPSEQAAVMFVLDLAKQLRLLHAQGQQLVLSEQSERWLELPVEQRREQLWQVAFAEWLPLESWIEAFAMLMKELEPNEWFALDDLLALVTELGCRLPQDAETILLNRWLHLLLGLGWVRLGRDRQGRNYVQIVPICGEAADARWYIDPAGVLTLPPNVTSAKLWQVSRYGEISFQLGAMACQLTDAAGKQAVAEGESAQEIADFLQKSCAHPLPEAVHDLLGRWERDSRSILLDRVVRVRLATPQLAEELQQIPALRQWIDSQISPTEFLIPERWEAEWCQTVKEHGYPLTCEGSIDRAGNSEAESSREQCQRSNVSNVKEAETPAWPWPAYQFQSRFPDRYEGLEEIVKLPKMWTRHFQAYHPQTLRTMLAQAIQLELEICWENKQGTIQRSFPVKLKNEHGYWRVVCLNQTAAGEILLDDIARLQILLPACFDGMV
ncbi:hypothetical protein [Brevibacillus fulvus]|uniref:Helicase XPB/Ssl2 N-terminal domain-containing protein n=1 Tax=Brevibacillus fulvus TaxID=1125967 RepID=A0A939BQI5_9BACL|nr:hypothetical protein [Brevibacillus fulvus]MBM7588542.1 hypothetical protein [Brevibacillus fulvus]